MTYINDFQFHYSTLKWAVQTLVSSGYCEVLNVLARPRCNTHLQSYELVCFLDYLPFQVDTFLHLNKLQYPLPKDCKAIWLKLANENRIEVENVKSQTKCYQRSMNRKDDPPPPKPKYSIFRCFFSGGWGAQNWKVRNSVLKWYFKTFMSFNSSVCMPLDSKTKMMINLGYNHMRVL